MRSWVYRRRGRGSERRSLLTVALAVFGILLCLRLLLYIWTVFQHAYLNSLVLLAGSQVGRAYWAAIRFAFGATVVVVALGAVLATLVALQLRDRRR